MSIIRNVEVIRDCNHKEIITLEMTPKELYAASKSTESVFTRIFARDRELCLACNQWCKNHGIDEMVYRQWLFQENAALVFRLAERIVPQTALRGL